MANVSADYTERLTQACNASVAFEQQFKGSLHRFNVEQFYEMFAEEILYYKPIELLGGQVWGEGILIKYDCDDLARMYESGVIPSSIFLDLLEGHLFTRPDISQEAVFAELDLATEVLGATGTYMKGGQMVQLAVKTALMPAIAVLQGSAERYEHRFASIGDVQLIAEAVDEKPAHFEFKLQALARAVLPEYWLLNMKTKQLEVYTQSNGIEFGNVQVLEVGQKATPLEFPDAQVRWW